MKSLRVTKKQNIVALGVKFYAHPKRGCAGCEFVLTDFMCVHIPCGADKRRDNTSVIFKRTKP